MARFGSVYNWISASSPQTMNNNSPGAWMNKCPNRNNSNDNNIYVVGQDNYSQLIKAASTIKTKFNTIYIYIYIQ